MKRNKQRDLPKIWVGLDGIDATGKTTTVATLGQQLTDSQILGEFSDTAVGDLIREIIASKRFFSLGRRGDGRTAVADLCLILTDWAAKRERANLSSYHWLLSDRSFTSVVGYQVARLRRQLPTKASRPIEKALLEMVFSIQNAQPQLFNCEILLKISRVQMLERMKARGERPPTPHRIEELMLAQDIMCDLVNRRHVVDVSALSKDAVVKEVSRLVATCTAEGPH